MVATSILSLRLRMAEVGHLAVFHQNLSGGKAVPLQYIPKSCIFRIHRIHLFLCNSSGVVNITVFKKY